MEEIYVDETSLTNNEQENEQRTNNIYLNSDPPSQIHKT